MNNYQICNRCVIDSTIPETSFDSKGVCNYCYIYDKIDNNFKNLDKQKKKFKTIISQIKKGGAYRKYDCIVGVSGGQDSTYTLYMAKKYGLNPLAVHFDNGWNSETSIRNIKKITSKLNVDLYTYVVNWQEFRDLQLSFLKASVPDAEIPTDIGIKETLYRLALKNKILI